jgi:hypothetical protein
MIADPIQKALPIVAQMSFETWVSILLAALAVLLAAVTLVVAIAGMAIALVGIWGLKALRRAAEQKAHDAVKQTIAGYPDAADFIKVSQAMRELYRLMGQQMSEFKQEFEVLHQRSEAANEILDRLSTKRSPDASNQNAGVGEFADIVVEPMSSTYPGEEAYPDDGNIGKSIKDEGAGPADSR